MNKYFKTDGIRGIVREDLSSELLIKVGKACRMFNVNKIFISTDTRISKDFVFTALSLGLISSGIDVYYLGVLSTPALIYLCEKYEMVGISITASHNPYYYNGIKIINKGNKLTLDEEAKMEKLIDLNLDDSDRLGIIRYEEKLAFEYMNYLSIIKAKTKKKICIDAANGAMSYIAKQIFSSITDDLIIINDNPSGYNINNNCGATDVCSLRKCVLENNYDIGFSYDGDGDRIIAVDRFGNIIDGDMIIYIFIRYFIDLGLLRNNKVALTIMSNLGIINDLKKRGIEVIECNVGDKYILEELNRHDLQIGGESSGHIILKDFLSTGDGLLISLKLIDILNDIDDFDYYLKDVNMFDSKTVNVSNRNFDEIINKEGLVNKINEYKNMYKDNIKIILRPSGTEKLIRLTVMSEDKLLTHKIISEILGEINKNQIDKYYK